MAPDDTPLKQGVNESSVNTWFVPPAGLAKKRDAPLPRRIQNLALSNPAPPLFHLAKEA
jgi:hypothetical protein